jgi:peptidyl-prolyl cis-trans isomerase A (cyclophilin A)
VEGLPEGWYAVVKTSRGDFTARLLVDQAPQTVAHFAAFAEGRLEWVDTVTGEKKKEPYYDGVLVHKIARGERLEAGDPTGTGRGYPLVYVPLELGPKNFSVPYRMGMTRSGGGKISAALFFVTRTNQDFLNGRFPCFAEVVRGRETVDAICRVLVDREERPTEPVEIVSIRVRSSGSPPPLPEPKPYTPALKKFGAKSP